MHNGKGWCGCTVMWVVKILLIVGGLNWGLVGLGMLMGEDWNVVEMLLGAWPLVLAVVYLLVGVAAVAKLVGCKCRTCKDCRVSVPQGGQGMGNM